MYPNNSTPSPWPTFWIGLGIVLIWITCWQSHYDDIRIAALARIEACPEPVPSGDRWWNKIGTTVEKGFDSVFTECGRRFRRETDEVQTAFENSMGRVMLATPLAFILVSLTRGGGRWLASGLQTASVARAERLRLKAYEAQDRTLVLENEAAKFSDARVEFVKRLGIISSYLDLLAEPSASNQVVMLKQNISRELCELVAGNAPDELIGLIRSDKVVQYKLRTLEQRFNELAIKNDDAQLMFSLASADSGARLL
ncbi:hypothetical protein ACG04Q_21495 [Roseateles sp. DXS20W]|uniref:Uncharacterized protein n=1 Tax=Pelomonas lactea TaxID=3299030 RepID=A0ABW7GQA4_9BURK